MRIDVTKILSHDSKNPTSKADLCKATGLSERTVRLLIAGSRHRGVRIVAKLTGGYYIADLPEDWDAFCEQERRRALSTFKTKIGIHNGQERFSLDERA